LILLLASWAVFASTTGKDAECKVEAESGKGVVIASGKFGDIINGSGSYTFGYVIGAWLMSGLPIALIAVRIKDLPDSKEKEVAHDSAEGEVVKPEPKESTESTNTPEKPNFENCEGSV